MRPRKLNVPRTAFAISTPALLALNTGCTVKGFQSLEDGPATPSTLRSAAVIARAEAEALDEIADIQEGAFQKAIGSVQAAAESLGAPALMTGALAGGLGFLTPTPGQRRRETAAKDAKK
tara:strand:- start:2879 stop:3238 length:360 start_codon:yes stop_codon:yes gene_type:complete